MRVKQSASFPYPVLADSTGDYGSKRFQLSLIPQEQIGAGNVFLSGSLALEDESIITLIEAGKARSGLMIHCRDTYLDDFEESKIGEVSLDLAGGIVRGKVYVRGVVVAQQDCIKLQSPAINSEFPEDARLVNAGDLIAMTEELSFEAGLEKLAPMESIFRLRRQDDLGEGVFQLDLEGEAIEILAAPSLHQFLSLLREQEAKDTLLSSLYLPVVMSVLEIMRDEPAYEDRRWYNVMSARCSAEGVDLKSADLGDTAQRLLDSPLGSLQKVFEKLGGA